MGVLETIHGVSHDYDLEDTEEGVRHMDLKHAQSAISQPGMHKSAVVISLLVLSYNMNIFIFPLYAFCNCCTEDINQFALRLVILLILTIPILVALTTHTCFILYAHSRTNRLAGYFFGALTELAMVGVFGFFILMILNQYDQGVLWKLIVYIVAACVVRHAALSRLPCVLFYIRTSSLKSVLLNHVFCLYLIVFLVIPNLFYPSAKLPSTNKPEAKLCVKACLEFGFSLWNIVVVNSIVGLALMRAVASFYFRISLFNINNIFYISKNVIINSHVLVPLFFAPWLVRFEYFSSKFEALIKSMMFGDCDVPVPGQSLLARSGLVQIVVIHIALVVPMMPVMAYILANAPKEIYGIQLKGNLWIHTQFILMPSFTVPSAAFFVCEGLSVCIRGFKDFAIREYPHLVSELEPLIMIESSLKSTDGGTVDLP